MKVLAVDDEEHSLEMLKRAISKAAPEAELQVFTKASAALTAVENGFLADVAFLDIEMPGMTGIEMARRLKALCGEMNIIFVTGFSSFALEAHELRASGYVLKPVSAEQIERELADLRHPVLPDDIKKLTVRTFPNFEVFVGTTPVEFDRSKSKEIFAYLIDRNGTKVTYPALAAILWEDGLYDRSRQKQLHTLIHDMIHTLKAVGADDVIVKSRLGIMVDTEKVDCDAYRFFQGDLSAINAYRGEYMSAYSWSEFSTGRFDDRE